MGGDRGLKEQRFCMPLKVHWCKFKLKCLWVLNVISMVTTKKIAIEYTHKEMRRNFNFLQFPSFQFPSNEKEFLLQKEQLNTKEDNKERNKGRGSYKAFRKQVTLP